MIRRIFPLLFGSLMLTGSVCAEDEPPALTVMSDPHHTVAAIYPPSEQEDRHSGTATIHCTITPTGIAKECHVLSATAPDFGLAAVQAALASRFLPQYADTQPQEASWEHTYTFTTDPTSSRPILDKTHSRPPRYPAYADDLRMSGEVTVNCDIDPVGVAHNCTASGDSPELLKTTTLAYFALARYFPAMTDGKPVSSHYRGHVNWNAVHPDDQQGFR